MNLENNDHGTTVSQRLLSEGKNNSSNSEREAMIPVYRSKKTMKKTSCTSKDLYQQLVVQGWQISYLKAKVDHQTPTNFV
jgi:hypothetical protein